MRVLVTGVAGFIGYHVARALCARGDEVVGTDSLNDQYEVDLKEARLRKLEPSNNFRVMRLDLADRDGMAGLVQAERFNRVVHLGAQAGVRYSLENPHAYIDSNLVGFMNVLEGCRHNGVEHLVYASSSSVYGPGVARTCRPCCSPARSPRAGRSRSSITGNTGGTSPTSTTSSAA